MLSMLSRNRKGHQRANMFTKLTIELLKLEAYYCDQVNTKQVSKIEPTILIPIIRENDQIKLINTGIALRQQQHKEKHEKIKNWGKLHQSLMKPIGHLDTEQIVLNYNST